jgi:hypothetical protein
MSQRRQEARRAKQERRREERKAATRSTSRPRPATTNGVHASPAPARVAPAAAGPGFWTKRTKLIAGGALAAIVLIAVGVWVFMQVRAPLPGQQFEDQGGVHLNSADDPHPEYNSNPPTSGWHLPPVPRPGIYTQDRRPEDLGHFMEHGGVWLLYDCPDGCADDVRRLEQLANEWIDRGRPVAVSPYSRMDHRFAAVAWTYLLTQDRLEVPALDNFISRHGCRYNPEGGPYCVGVRGAVATPPATMEGRNNIPITVVPPTSVFQTPAPVGSPAGTPPPVGTPAATTTP